MAGDLTISWGNLDNLFASMNAIQQQSVEIDHYFATEVCSTAGFDYDYCVLRPIADQLVKVGGVFSDVRGVFEERWSGTVDAMVTSARQVDAADNRVSIDFGRRLMGDAPTATQVQMGPPTGVDIDIEAFPLDDPATKLSAPGDGEKTIEHNHQWEAITDSFDALRDGINDGISKINSVGVVHIEPLTSKSLDEYVVYPLSGNYLKIQGNASACGKVEDAMTVWSGNFSAVSGTSLAAMGGGVGASLVVHLELYHLVTRAVGELIGAGSAVFNAIALVSEKIAVAVENALVTMAKILLRVSRRIASRLLGFFGWALFVKDLVAHGLGAITDIWDDIMLAKEIIESCFELKSAIEDWAEEKAAQLKAFEEMATIISELPEAAASGGLGGLPPTGPQTVETRLGDITYDFGSDGGSQGALEEELDDLEDEYPEELGDDGEDEAQSDGLVDLDDGETLMAPGLPPVLGGPESTPPMTA